MQEWMFTSFDSTLEDGGGVRSTYLLPLILSPRVASGMEPEGLKQAWQVLQAAGDVEPPVKMLFTPIGIAPPSFPWDMSMMRSATRNTSSLKLGLNETFSPSNGSEDSSRRSRRSVF
eukprot:4950593-Pyramimonas_sp.AAC.1